MLSLYDDYAERNGVLTVPRRYDAQRQIVINGLRSRGGPGLVVATLLFATLLPFYIAWRMRRQSESA